MYHVKTGLSVPTDAMVHVERFQADLWQVLEPEAASIAAITGLVVREPVHVSRSVDGCAGLGAAVAALKEAEERRVFVVWYVDEGDSVGEDTARVLSHLRPARTAGGTSWRYRQGSHFWRGLAEKVVVSQVTQNGLRESLVADPRVAAWFRGDLRADEVTGLGAFVYRNGWSLSPGPDARCLVPRLKLRPAVS